MTTKNFATIFGRVHRRVGFVAYNGTVRAVEWIPCDRGKAAFDSTVASRRMDFQRIAGGAVRIERWA